MLAQQDWVAREIAPWFDALDALERWRRDLRARSPDEATVAGLRSALQALARGQVAVPREMPLTPDPLARAFAAPESEAQRATWRARRVALLRLAVWRALRALQGTQPPDGPVSDAMAALQEAMASTEMRVPPGLSPSLDCAADAKAQQFFGGSVHAILQRLAERHAGHAAWLERLSAARHEVSSVAGAQAWSEAWSVGIAANYLNCLQAKSGGDLNRAMALVWSDKATRLHAADKLLLLPARERHLHMDLWTDLVQAQALDHQPERFATPSPWHRVGLKMHDLGVHEQVEGGAPMLFDRGIGVDLLHLPVFADRAWLALQAQPQTGHAAAAAARPQTIVVDLPELAPGQAANLRLVLRMAGTPGDEDPPRLLASFEPPALNAEQQALYRQWADRDGGVARVLAPDDLCWQVTYEADAAGEAGGAPPPGALGSAALWRAAAGPGGTPQWLDVALVVRRQGRWTQRPLEVRACVVAGELRCALGLDDEGQEGAEGQERDPSDAALLRRALRDPARAWWVGTRAGLGALVMVGVDLDGAASAHGR